MHDPNLPIDQQGGNDPANTPQGEEIRNSEDENLEQDDDVEIEEAASIHEGEDEYIAFEDVEHAFTTYIRVQGNEDAIANLQKLLADASLTDHLYFGRTLFRSDVDRLCEQLDWHEICEGTLKMLDTEDVQNLNNVKINFFCQ